MRLIRCEHCDEETGLALGHRPENHQCDRCRQPLPRDREVACDHCGVLNAVTWDADPTLWTCGGCGFALASSKAPVLPRRQATHLGLSGGAILGGLAGALLGADERSGKGVANAGALFGAALGALIGGLVGTEVERPPPPTPAKQAEWLADWIRAWYPYGDSLTHLKLQRLAFYCHGIALAYGLERPFEDLTFEAWAHGPVCRPIWERFRHLGSRALDPVAAAPSLPPSSARVLVDVLTVYGALDDWRLGQQIQLEAPWQVSWSAHRPYIDRTQTRHHFTQLYQSGPVEPPAYLFDGGSFRVDGIPLQRYASLADLAEALR